MYTTQLVINGSSEMVGSDELKIRSAITKALTIENFAEISITSKQTDNFLALDYRVVNTTENSQILIAVIRKSAATKVERGENKGHVLSHVQIVCGLQNESLNKEGKGNANVRLPQGFNK